MIILELYTTLTGTSDVLIITNWLLLDVTVIGILSGVVQARVCETVRLDRKLYSDAKLLFLVTLINMRCKGSVISLIFISNVSM